MTGVGGNTRRHFDHGGRLFTMYKFRTMYQMTTEQEKWAAADDARVTPFGAILRRLRLDDCRSSRRRKPS
jgi:lipopolysaccharide/colanic/teichoic acid biosynthesis glycosyltransferase